MNNTNFSKFAVENDSFIQSLVSRPRGSGVEEGLGVLAWSDGHMMVTTRRDKSVKLGHDRDVKTATCVKNYAGR